MPAVRLPLFCLLLAPCVAPASLVPLYDSTQGSVPQAQDWLDYDLLGDVTLSPRLFQAQPQPNPTPATLALLLTGLISAMLAKVFRRPRPAR